MPAATLPTPPDSPTSSGANHLGDFTMQKYLMLQSQHQELRQHIDYIRSTTTFFPAMSMTTPTTTSTTASASYTSTPAVSPTRAAYSPSFGQCPPVSWSRNHRRSSMSGPPKTRPGSTALGPLPDESILHQVADEERRLFDVNEGMKRMLMEMLNGEQAKNDGSFRTWVQCRLMETEKELRSERRRKSAP